MGSTASNSAVATLVERATGFVMLLHLPEGHGAIAVQDALVAKIATLDEQLRLSLTWDQGREMTNHVQIVEVSGGPSRREVPSAGRSRELDRGRY